MFHDNLWPMMIEETNSIYVLKRKKDGMQTHLSSRLRGAVGQESETDELKTGTYKNQRLRPDGQSKADIWEAGNS